MSGPRRGRRQLRARRPGLWPDGRGTAMVEYLVLVGLFGITSAAGLAILGFPLLRYYRVMTMLVTIPA
jgi:hypothetical protein